MNREAFGKDRAGDDVEQLTIAGGGLTASVMTWGACLQDLRITGHEPSLVLGFDAFEPYPNHSRNFGAIVGRCANRVRSGHCTIDGVEHQLDRNAGGHHLHGGTCGIGKRNWHVAQLAPNRVTMEITDPDGMMGYPGTCQLRVTYALPGDGVLDLTMEARCDRTTLINLAPHSYFNLDGTPTISDHRLLIDAVAYLPTDRDGLPTGEVRPVEGTDFDFRHARPVGDASAFDNNYCLSNERVALRPVAELYGARSGIAMSLATTEAGLQFYDGHKLDVPVAGLDGRLYRSRAGLCLEPQNWPDAVNRPGFPSPLVRPRETYLHRTRYRFFHNDASWRRRLAQRG